MDSIRWYHLPFFFFGSSLASHDRGQRRISLLVLGV